MTKQIEIPDSAVEVGVRAMQVRGWTGGYDAFGDDLRAAIQAALPIILGEPVGYVTALGEIDELDNTIARQAAVIGRLESGITKALDELEDNGPKAAKYAAQELRAALGDQS